MSTQTERRNNGNCNWWCRNRKKILGIVVATLTGGPVAGLIALGGALLSDGGLARIYEVELTISEETKLDAFIDRYFLPFYNALIIKVDGAIVNKSSVFRNISNPVILNVNEVQKQIAILKAWLLHTTQYPPTGYSKNMITARNQFVNEQLDVLEKAVADYLASKQLSVSETVNKVAASSITSAHGMVYKWHTPVTTSYKVLNPNDVVQDLHSDPVEIEITSEIAEAIQTLQPTTTNTAPTTTKSGNTWKIASVAALAAFFIGKTFSSSKKKSK